MWFHYPPFFSSCVRAANATGIEWRTMAGFFSSRRAVLAALLLATLVVPTLEVKLGAREKLVRRERQARRTELDASAASAGALEQSAQEADSLMSEIRQMERKDKVWKDVKVQTSGPAPGNVFAAKVADAASPANEGGGAATPVAAAAAAAAAPPAAAATATPATATATPAATAVPPPAEGPPPPTAIGEGTTQPAAATGVNSTEVSQKAKDIMASEESGALAAAERNTEAAPEQKETSKGDDVTATMVAGVHADTKASSADNTQVETDVIVVTVNDTSSAAGGEPGSGTAAAASGNLPTVHIAVAGPDVDTTASATAVAAGSAAGSEAAAVPPAAAVAAAAAPAVAAKTEAATPGDSTIAAASTTSPSSSSPSSPSSSSSSSSSSSPSSQETLRYAGHPCAAGMRSE